jgi:hypothetical protein
MTRSVRAALLLPISLAWPLYFGGCGEDSGAAPNAAGPMAPGGAPPPGFGGGPGGQGDQAVTAPGIRLIMSKLTKGPNSLTGVIARELNEPQPPWETIQAQTKEYAQLAGEMANYEPPKGSKESWAKETAAYEGLALDLSKAAEARDKDQALAAHGQITNSCQSCHRAHRAMGRGMGGPPGFGPGGPGGGPPGFGPRGPRGPGGPGGPPDGPPPGGRPPG